MGHESDRHRGRNPKKSRKKSRDNYSSSSEEESERGHRSKKRKADDDGSTRKDRSRKEDRTSSSSRHRGKKEEEDDGRERRHGKHRHRKHDSKESSSRSKKRHRDDDDSSRYRKKKHDSKKKDKKKRSKKESASSSSYPKKLKVDKSKLFPLGDPLGYAPEKLLDPEKDYFSYHKHLWLYLYRDCAVSFNDLSSEQARSSFADFCKLYNSGGLEAAYYSDKLPSAALDECKTTSHSWGLRISDQEDKRLQFLQEGIQKQTEYQGDGAITSAAAAAAPNSRASSAMPTVGASTTQIESQLPPPEQNKQNRIVERRANRSLREHVLTSQEELMGGRKDGRERQIEKRREVADKIHGAARDRDAQAASIELTDDALYGGQDSREFAKSLEKSKQRTARREEQRQTRVKELENKEKEKQTAMLEMLGLSGKIQAGEKIQIAPRKDPP